MENCPGGLQGNLNWMRGIIKLYETATLIFVTSVGRQFNAPQIQIRLFTLQLSFPTNIPFTI